MRTLALGTAAILTHDLGAVLWVLLAFTGVKVALLFAYISRYHGLRGPLARREAFSVQLKQAAPFALSRPHAPQPFVRRPADTVAVELRPLVNNTLGFRDVDRGDGDW